MSANTGDIKMDQLAVIYQDRRALRNAQERKRRDKLKSIFNELKESIPSIQSEKTVTRALILKKAADFIRYMKNKNASHWKDLGAIKAENAYLEAQLAAMEKTTERKITYQAEIREDIEEFLVISSDSETDTKPEFKLEIKEELDDEDELSDSSDSDDGYSFEKHKKLKFGGKFDLDPPCKPEGIF